MSRLIDSCACLAESLSFVTMLLSLSLAAKPLDAITYSFNESTMFLVMGWSENADTKHVCT